MEVTIDKPSLDSSLAKLQGAIAAKMEVLHLTSKDCITVEAGRLCEYMIDRALGSIKTKNAIARKVLKNFISLGEDVETKSQRHSTDGKLAGHGHSSAGMSEGSVEWYAFSPTGI